MVFGRKGDSIGLVGEVRILKGRCCLGWAFSEWDGLCKVI